MYQKRLRYLQKFWRFVLRSGSQRIFDAILCLISQDSDACNFGFNNSLENFLESSQIFLSGASIFFSNLRKILLESLAKFSHGRLPAYFVSTVQPTGTTGPSDGQRLNFVRALELAGVWSTCRSTCFINMFVNSNQRKDAFWVGNFYRRILRIVEIWK